MARKVCIVGTAGSYRLTPWTDKDMEIWSLNNAYECQGFQRADRWYDFHPLDKFYHHDSRQPVYAHHIPPGFHVRPKTHIDWLSRLTIPVYLHPDYLTQHPPAAAWTHAHPMPVADLQQRFGHYWMSGPSWMVAHAIAEGVDELWITGIHLATEGEYIRQRPNFEMFLGMFLGSEARLPEVRKGDLRYIRTATKTLVLPVESPLLQGPSQYPFEPHPDMYLEGYKWEAHKVGVKRRRELATLANAPWWAIGKKQQARERLEYLDALAEDVRDQMAWERQTRQGAHLS